MHWVDRGPEPANLAEIRIQYTQGWVNHYIHEIGQRPTDTRWREFHKELSRIFSGLCAYCEEIDKGEVDHFKPIKEYPHLVYEWANWVFACHNCNQSKSNKWPAEGYINPCAENELERPERFFTFNAETLMIRPMPEIPCSHQEMAQQMIMDLKLNAPHHIQMRKDRLSIISRHLDILDQDSEEAQEYLSTMIDRTSPLSSIVRALLDDLGFDIDE